MSFVDFDEDWAAARSSSEPPRIKLYGVVHDLPPSLPAKIVLHAQRWKDEKGADLTFDYALEHLGLLLGAEIVDGWIDAGITQAEIFEVYFKVTALYRMRGAGEGEARPPATGDSPGTSSKAGPSSPPTGSGSGGGG